MKRLFSAVGLVCLGASSAFAIQQPGRSATPVRSPAASVKSTASAAPLSVTARAPQAAPHRSLLARITVYWASGGGGSDKWTRKHQAATSVRLRAGHCAVDPRQIPYGSRVCLGDSTLLAVDTGKHVVTRKAARLSGKTASEKNALVIDRFFETKRQAEAWANSHPPFMTVQVVPPGAKPPVTPEQRPAFAGPTTTKLIAYNSPRSGGLARSASSLP